MCVECGPEERPLPPPSPPVNTILLSCNHSLWETKITIHLENEINSFKLGSDHREKCVGWCLAEGKPAGSRPLWFREVIGPCRSPSSRALDVTGEFGSSLTWPPSSDEDRVRLFFITASSEPLGCLRSSSKSFSGQHAAVSLAFWASQHAIKTNCHVIRRLLVHVKFEFALCQASRSKAPVCCLTSQGRDLWFILCHFLRSLSLAVTSLHGRPPG